MPYSSNSWGRPRTTRQTKTRTIDHKGYSPIKSTSQPLKAEPKLNFYQDPQLATCQTNYSMVSQGCSFIKSAGSNKQKRGADKALQDQLLKEQLTIYIIDIYNQLRNHLANDQSIFEGITQEEILSGPTLNITTWLWMAEPTIHQCLKVATTKLSSNQSNIQDTSKNHHVNFLSSDTTLSYDTLATS